MRDVASVQLLSLAAMQCLSTPSVCLITLAHNILFNVFLMMEQDDVFIAHVLAVVL